MKLTLMILLPFLLTAQNQVTIDLSNRSINITYTASVSELNNANMSYLNGKDFIFIEVDSLNSIYYHDYWGGKKNKKDTFVKIKTKIIRKKNVTSVIPSISKTSYQLHRQLFDKSWQEKDSIMNTTMQKVYKWQPSRDNRRVSYEVTPIQYYQNKYPYIDIYETNREKGRKRDWYTSEATRIFIIGEIFYYIYMSNNDLETAKSIRSSRKAVCCDFKRLVNNIKIIDPDKTNTPK